MTTLIEQPSSPNPPTPPTQRPRGTERAERRALAAELAAERTRQRGPFRNVLHSIGVGISAGFLLLTLGLALIVVVLPIAVGGSAYTVLTGSMEPKLPPGTFLIVKPTPASEVRVGEVITYQLVSGRPEVATHRVIERILDPRTAEVSFITKGDANNTPDAAPVIPVQLRGTVWYAVPYLGWVNNVLNGEARAWLVPIVAGLLLAYAGWMFVAGLLERRALRARHRLAQSR